MREERAGRRAAPELPGDPLPVRRAVSARAVAGLALGLALGLPAGAGAQALPAGEPELRLSLGGYLRSLTGVHDAGFDPPGGDRRSGFHSDVLRLRWRATWGERVTLDAHQRLQARVSTAPEGFGRSVAGLGVTAVPGRTVDLESVWIDDGRLRVWHDVDRLAVSVYTPAADVSVGRQAVTWGDALLFPVADLWSRFSPYELDTEEKPGVDAIRILTYPASGLELDLVVADRGAQDDVSAGARASLALPTADVYVAGGRLWDEALLMGGLVWVLEATKLRLEGVLPRDLARDRWEDPRATLGVDWLGARVGLTAEYHFNGLGAGEPAAYLERLRSETFERGESYFLGRHYLGGLARWSVDEADRIQLSGSLLLNAGDPSAALSPALAWDLGGSIRLSVGGLLAWGRTPRFRGAIPELRSEYGSYGDLGYTRFSLYF